MYYRSSLAIVVFFLMLSTATPSLANCNPAAIAGTWYLLNRYYEDGEDGVEVGWDDCVLKLNKKGNIRSLSGVALGLGACPRTRV